VFGFCRRKGLGENVGSHISSRTEDKFELARFNSKTNKMETDVDMFSVGVIAVVLGKCDGGHVVRMKWKMDGVEIAEISLIKFCNQIASLVAWVIAVYSASAVERVMSS